MGLCVGAVRGAEHPPQFLSSLFGSGVLTLLSQSFGVNSKHFHKIYICVMVSSFGELFTVFTSPFRDFPLNYATPLVYSKPKSLHNLKLCYWRLLSTRGNK